MIYDVNKNAINTFAINKTEWIINFYRLRQFYY